MSIKNKLIILVLTVLIPVLAITFILVIFWGVNDYRNDMKSSARLYTRLICDYCITPLAFGDYNGAGEMLMKIRAIPTVTEVRLYNEDDSLVARYATAATLLPEGVDPLKQKEGFYSHYLLTAEPVIHKKFNYGKLILVTSLDTLRIQTRNYILLMAGVMVLILLVSYFLTNWLQRYISGPVLMLSEFTNRISREGNFKLRIEKVGNDEIGTLFDRVNEMLEQINLRETASKKAGQEMRLANEKLNLILDNAPFGFMHYDQDGVITTLNRGHESLFDLERNTLLGKNLHQTIEDEEMRQAFLSSLEGTPSVYTGLYTSTTSGISTHIRAIYTPLFSEDQKVIGGVGIFEDISEQKRIEKLQVEKEAAVFANKAKSAFLANMSHEIRTPLNAILGFTQLMSKDESLRPDQRENVTIINTSGEHLLALINNVLEMSKIEAGRISLNDSSFNIRGLVGDIVNLFRTKTDEKKLSLQTQVMEEMPDYLFGDEGKIRQVLINLLGNAVKFTSEGGIIVRVWTIDAPPDKLILNMEVEDTGIGIAAEEMDKVFVYFEQTRSGISTHSGTGLGLAICKEYVRMMNGDIEVTSISGKGSVFHFFVEVKECSEAPARNRMRHATVTGMEPGQGVIKILVVDDKEPNRKLLTRMLSPVGFIIGDATNGEEAVEMFEHWHPDLILMDMVMPVMDGYEAIRTIRQMPGGKEILIFSITASVFEEDKYNIFESGADEFIMKPFREEDIYQKITDRMGIKFVYRCDKKEDSGTASVDLLTPEVIASFPPEMSERTRLAILNGDIQVIEEEFTALQVKDPSVKTALLNLLRNFDFDRLNRLFHV